MTATSSENDNFEATAAAVLAEGPVDTGTPGSAPGESSASAVLVAGVSEAAVAHWIDVPFKVLAAAFRNPDLKLEDYEREMFVPSLTACINKYAPEMLKRTDNPEVAMLGMAVLAYAGRVGLFTWLNQSKEKQDSSKVSTLVDTTTQESRAFSAQLGNRDAGKVFASVA